MKKTGKVHADNSFDDVDDSTPMVSPAKRPDRDPFASSPYKPNEEAQDVEDSVDSALPVQREKSPNRQKRGSTVGSRSRSPRRPIARTDDDGSDHREGDGNGSRAGDRSVATSPRSRNRRGAGGKGEEETDEESDASRAAPRSDIDNGGGKQWQTPDSGRAGRAGQRGGTRTHKSPPASPSSRRDSTRGRRAASMASKNSNAGDSEREDDGEDNGASPRGGRKATRKGDWEKQMARSNAAQAQPRRRRPNTDRDGQESDRRRRKRDDDEEEGND